MSSVSAIFPEGKFYPQDKEQPEDEREEFKEATKKFKENLYYTYRNFSARESWENKLAGDWTSSLDGKISPMFKMNGTLYDSFIADPYFGHQPHPKMPPFNNEAHRTAQVIAFMREPGDYDSEYEDHYLDSVMMKNLHSLAFAYRHSVVFHWVDIKTDPDLIAFSLGIDTLDPAFFPVFTLIQGNSMYIAPKQVTYSYHNMA